MKALCTTDETEVSEMVRALVDAFRPVQIVLFGSRARGDAGADSDVDLLVVADTQLDPVERSFLAHRALGRRRTPVDVLVYTPDELVRYGAWRSHVAHAAITEGRVVYEAA